MFQFYTATVTPTTGTSFSLSSPDWFSGLKAGEVLSLDYQMTFDGEVQPKITSILLNGNDACTNENRFYAQIGNAVCVPVIKAIGKCIVEKLDDQ